VLKHAFIVWKPFPLQLRCDRCRNTMCFYLSIATPIAQRVEARHSAGYSHYCSQRNATHNRSGNATLSSVLSPLYVPRRSTIATGGRIKESVRVKWHDHYPWGYALWSSSTLCRLTQCIFPRSLQPHSAPTALSSAVVRHTA